MVNEQVQILHQSKRLPLFVFESALMLSLRELSVTLAASEGYSITSNAVKRLATSRRSEDGGVEHEYKSGWLY